MIERHKGSDSPEALESLREEVKRQKSARLVLEQQLSELHERVERLQHRFDLQTEKLRQAELELHLMVSELPWGVLLEDAEGRISLANQEYCRLFRLSIEAHKLRGTDLHAVEQHARALFIDPDEYVARLNSIRGGSEPALGDVLQLSTGSVWQRDCVPVETRAGKRGWLHLLRDITDQRTRRAELERAKADAEEAHKSTIHFLASMSQEMRAPISAILGVTELLASECPGEAGQRLLARLSLNAGSLLGLVEDVLAIAQLDEGGLRLAEGPVAPRDLVQAVAAQLQEAVREKGLELQVFVDESLPHTVLGDEARIRQLLVGLVGNAIKFTPSGCISLRVYRPKQGSLDDICYEVEDTGIGIPERDLPRVFDRFYRANADVPGIGLGLNICRDLVHLMGGRVGIDSVEGQRTCAFFTLKQPALAEDQPSALDQCAPRTRWSGAPAAPEGARVLCVEDDPVNRMMITRLLEKGGYVVHPVESAPSALEVLQQERFDALVTDISMPQMDGIQLVAALRELESRTGRTPTPAIVVTAHALPEYQERCREAGVDVYLTKPIKVATLRRAIAKVTQEVAKILVVDDSWDARILLEVCLNQYPAPLEVVAANSGRTAVAACEARVFSLIFMDALMPDLGGVEALRQIRRLPGYQATPIVAVTGLSDPADIEALEAQGFDGIVQKPFDRRKIYRAVRDHLRASAVISRLTFEQTALELAPTLRQLGAARSSPEAVQSSSADERTLTELVPAFLDKRRSDIDQIRALERESRFDEIVQIGHRMKGTGRGFGFERITLLGRSLEDAAGAQDGGRVLHICGMLEGLLDSLQQGQVADR